MQNLLYPDVLYCVTFSTVTFYCTLQTIKACLDIMERIKLRALKIIFGQNFTNYSELLDMANVCTLENSRKINIIIQTFKILNKTAPSYLSQLVTVRELQYRGAITLLHPGWLFLDQTWT